MGMKNVFVQIKATYEARTLLAPAELLHVVGEYLAQSTLHFIRVQQRHRRSREGAAKLTVPVAGQLIRHDDVTTACTLVKVEAGAVPQLGEVGQAGFVQ